MVNTCRKCGHVEAEHDPLGCRHENYSEWRTVDDEGITIHTDLRLCGCPYFGEDPL